MYVYLYIYVPDIVACYYKNENRHLANSTEVLRLCLMEWFNKKHVFFHFACLVTYKCVRVY